MKKFWKALLLIGSGLLLVVGAYVAYVYLTYHRVPDNVKLKPVNRNSQILQTNHPYKAMTFNIGYAAYPDNYSFFMDGGKYSRAPGDTSDKRKPHMHRQRVIDRNQSVKILESTFTDWFRSITRCRCICGLRLSDVSPGARQR